MSNRPTRRLGNAKYASETLNIVGVLPGIRAAAGSKIGTQVGGTDDYLNVYLSAK